MLARLGKVLLVVSVSAETFWRWIKDLVSPHYTQSWSEIHDLNSAVN